MTSIYYYTTILLLDTLLIYWYSTIDIPFPMGETPNGLPIDRWSPGTSPPAPIDWRSSRATAWWRTWRWRRRPGETVVGPDRGHREKLRKMGETIGNSWETMGNSWENVGKCRKIFGKIVGTYGTDGKMSGKSWENDRKIWEVRGKSIEQIWVTRHLGTTFGKYGKRWETHEKILVYWDDIWELFGNIIARMCCWDHYWDDEWDDGNNFIH